MSKAMALLAGFGAGYFKAEDKKKDDERQAKRDARDEEQYQEGKADRQSIRDERNQALNDKNELRTAAAPVAVTTTPGQAMPASEGALASDNPTVGGYKAGANQFASEGLAAADAEKQNTPEARRARVMATMEKQGNFQGADEMATRGIQVEAAKSTLDENKQLSAGRAMARNVADTLARTGYQGLAKLMTEKYDDGNTYTAVEDGKGGAKVTAVTKDGKPVGSMDFANHADAIMAAVGKTNPEKWADYQTGREDKKQTQANSDRDFGLKQAAQAEAKRHNQTVEAAASARAAGGGSGGGTPSAKDFDPKAGLDDKKIQATVLEQIAKENEQRLSEGKPAMTEKEQGQKFQKLRNAYVDAFVAENNNRFATSVVSQSLRDAKDPVEYAQTYAKALKTGMDASTLQSLGFQAPATAGATPSPAARAARQGVAPAPAQAPVAPAQPAAPPPTMQQTQEFFRAKQAQMAEATQKFNADPRIPALMQKKNDAIRRGKAVEANSYLAEVQSIKQGYGL